MIAEDDVFPRGDVTPWLPEFVPELLLDTLALLNHRINRKLIMNSTLSLHDQFADDGLDTINKVQLGIKLGAKCKNCSLNYVSETLRSKWASWSFGDSLCLRECFEPHDARAYLIRRDLATKVLAAHTAVTYGNSFCDNPWYSMRHSCGSDPALLHHIFRGCKGQGGRHCRAISFGFSRPFHRPLLVHNNSYRNTAYKRYGIFKIAKDHHDFSLHSQYEDASNLVHDSEDAHL